MTEETVSEEDLVNIQPDMDIEDLVEQMSRDEKSLLLYMESCVVDSNGKLEAQRMNKTDFTIAKWWDKIGFVRFGRLPAREAFGKSHMRSSPTNWVKLTPLAWQTAHLLRRRRGERHVETVSFTPRSEREQ